jgi:hypothetical protein
MLSLRLRTKRLLFLCGVVLYADLAFAAEPFRVLGPSGGTRSAAVLIVPGCSGFVVRNGVNHYEERVRELRVAGYFVVFVDYLSRRQLTDCGGGRYVTHAQVAADVHETARWIRAMPGIDPSKIFVIGWSYGAGVSAQRSTGHLPLDEGRLRRRRFASPVGRRSRAAGLRSRQASWLRADR